MDIRDRIRKGLNRDSGGPGYVDGHAPENADRTKDMVFKGDSDAATAQRKQDPIRTATLPPRLAHQIRRREAVMKPYDVTYLKDIAANWVAQAYIDTMAQDAATAPWSLEPRDDATEVEDDAVAEAERFLEQAHPEKSFRDLREVAARNTLKMGDGAWVKHYNTAGELAEVVPVDSSRLFKKVDEHGLTEGYLQASFSRLEIEQDYDLEEIVWFEWASREDHVYGEGPVEKGQRLIEILEELNEKEVKDLEEGMPPGIVSVKEDEDTPLATDAYETVRDQWELGEGERHRAIVSMGDWQFTPLDSGYQELQFLDRVKLWIHSLGAVFKVNAPYAGFDFQEGNKAQNEAQVEAAKQRGFRVLLRQMEEAINRQLIWPDINEDLQFSFEDAQSIEEREAEAQHLQSLAQAAEDWDRLGRDVTLRDGTITVEDGPVETPEDDGGGGGGVEELFGSAQEHAKEDFDVNGTTITIDPPEAVVNAVEAGVEAREEYDELSECGTGDGNETARRVLDNELTPEYVADEIAAYLTSHEDDVADYDEPPTDWNRQQWLGMDSEDDDPRCGPIQYVLWAGTTTGTGKEWAQDIANDVAVARGEDELPYPQAKADELEDACWEGYEAVGFKIDENGNKVPNCVPEDEVESSTTARLDKSEVEELDELLLSAHEAQVQPADHRDIEKRSWGDDADVPQFVIDKIKDAIDSGAVFADIEGVPDRTIERVEQILEDSLTQPQGWSLDSIIQRFKDTYPGVAEDKLAVIARTETASILNQAREEGYEDIPSEEEPRFYWTGPEDSRTTPVCTADSVDGVTGLKGRTNPSHGGEPVSMGELIRQQEELQSIHHPDLRFRKHVPHINCRHTFVRYVEGQNE